MTWTPSRTCIIFLLVIFESTTSLETPLTPQDKAFKVYESFVLPHLTGFQDFLDEITQNTSIPISNKCRDSLVLFNHGLHKRTIEAMTMFASFSKGQPGFFSNRLSDFGHYKQCIDATFNGSNSRYFIFHLKFPTIPGQKYLRPESSQDHYHSVVTYQKASPYPVAHAICLPSQCRDEDVNNFLEDYSVTKKIDPLMIHMTSSESRADEDPFAEYWGYRFVSKLVIYSLALITIIATFFPDLLPPDSPLKAWDANANNRKIFGRTTELQDERLYVFNGYKAIYLLISLAAHVPLMFSFEASPVMFTTYHAGIASGMTNTLSACALAVNINFVTSAALATINLVPVMNRISLVMFVLGRALRTLPVILFVNLFLIAFPFFDTEPFGRGPLYLAIHKNHTANCVKNFWSDMLFMNNALPLGEMCNFVAWFIAVDFKLYVFSFITFYCLAKNQKLGLTLIGLQGLVGIIIHYYSLYINNINPPIAIAFESPNILINTLENAYFDTRGYIASYAVGILLGYILLKVKKSPQVSYLSTSISFICLLLCVKSFVSIYDPVTEEAYSLTWTQQLVYASTIRVFFLSSFAWLFYSSCLTSDSVIRFSKKRIFAIGSRLSFSTFMIHPFFVSYIQSTMTQDDPDFSFVTTFMKCLFVMVVSLPAGYLITVMVEFPCANLLKKVFETKTKIKGDVNKNYVNGKENCQELKSQ